MLPATEQNWKCLQAHRNGTNEPTNARMNEPPISWNIGPNRNVFLFRMHELRINFGILLTHLFQFGIGTPLMETKTSKTFGSLLMLAMHWLRVFIPRIQTFIAEIPNVGEWLFEYCGSWILFFLKNNYCCCGWIPSLASCWANITSFTKNVHLASINRWPARARPCCCDPVSSTWC